MGVITLHSRWSFPLRIFSINVTYTEEILNWKLRFFCSVSPLGMTWCWILFCQLALVYPCGKCHWVKPDPVRKVKLNRQNYTLWTSSLPLSKSSPAGKLSPSWKCCNQWVKSNTGSLILPSGNYFAIFVC